MLNVDLHPLALQGLMPQVLSMERRWEFVSLAAPQVEPRASFTAAAGSGAEEGLFVSIVAHNGHRQWRGNGRSARTPIQTYISIY